MGTINDECLTYVFQLVVFLYCNIASPKTSFTLIVKQECHEAFIINKNCAVLRLHDC